MEHENNNAQKYTGTIPKIFTLQDANANGASAVSGQNDANDVSIGRVAVKVPPLWCERPDLWFMQIEAQFANSGITGDSTKFNTIVAAIEYNVLLQVTDAVLRPPENDKYENLKQEILKRFGDSDQVRMHKLLAYTDLGDKRPSLLLSELRDLSNKQVTEEILKTLWMNRLPPNVRAILQAATGDLPMLAQLADRILEVGDFRNIAAVSNNSQQKSQNNDFDERMSRLERKLEQVLRRSRSKSPAKSNRRASSPQRSDEPVCWYHAKFNQQAQKCRSPCKFSKN